ncbi:MAG: DUF1800 family protein [Bacteroidetes bacterium]|nr:DUF1800 family protein [Bacteroidota bacterium]
MNLSAIQIVHLYNRAGFGINIDEFQAVRKKNVEEIVDDIFQKATNYKPLAISFSSDIPTKKFAEMSAEEKKEIVKLSKEGVKTLNLTWLNEMSSSTAFLQEKWLFFGMTILLVAIIIQFL